MLASAVQQGRNAQPKPGRGLAQQLFPSSSPSAQDANAATSGSIRHIRNIEEPLKPAGSAVLNGSKPPTHKAYVNPLKRSLSTMSSASVPSQGSQASRRFSSQSNRQAQPTPLPKHSSGLLGKLHADVSFDENDFVDDADIILDDSSPVVEVKPPGTISYPALPKIEPTYPSLPSLPQQTPSAKKLATSSIPIPWSSSPLSHRQPADPAILNRANIVPDRYPSKKPAPTDGVELDPEPERPVKRRTLPWLAAQETPLVGGANGGSDRMRRPKKERPEVDAFTPLPKDKGTTSYPWNQTASAIKAEQKRLRQQTNPAVAKGKTQTIKDETEPVLRKTKTKAKTIAQVFLSEEQQRVLDLVVNQKKSVFFTGSAGTGKSVLMREIIAQLRRRHDRETDRVAVTASTGLAACNIGGNTLHSFGGIGIGKEAAEVLIKKIRRNPKALNRWQRTKVLVIDEISMIDASLFDKLEQIARTLRRKSAPFGGIQLVITGDFFQLPPVNDGNTSAKFAFDASTWNTSIDHTIGLTHVFRQKDPVFANMLNEMRIGKLSPETIRAFQRLSRPLVSREDATEPTELFPTRNEVERANQLRMGRLGGTEFAFPAQDGGSAEVQQREKLLSNCMAPTNLVLKKGAQVMLIKNIDDTLVNGSIGKVVAFMDEKTFDHYDEHEEDFHSTAPSIDTAGPGEDMSSLSGGLSSRGTSAMPNLSPYRNTSTVGGPGNTSQFWPVVRFQIPDGTKRDLLCQRETWKIEQPNGEVLASRAQVPLILAWALSIHKAQGQTLERVKVDLGRTFEKGQAYVALSRATTQEGLQIARFDARKVMAHDRVRKFYDSLYGVETAADMSKRMPGGKVGKAKGGMCDEEFPFGPEDEDALAQMVM